MEIRPEGKKEKKEKKQLRIFNSHCFLIFKLRIQQFSIFVFFQNLNLPNLIICDIYISEFSLLIRSIDDKLLIGSEFFILQNVLNFLLKINFL